MASRLAPNPVRTGDKRAVGRCARGTMLDDRAHAPAAGGHPGTERVAAMQADTDDNRRDYAGAGARSIDASMARNTRASWITAICCMPFW